MRIDSLCFVLRVLIILALMAVLVTYGIIANYRLKQLSCANNSGPLDTFVYQTLNRWTFGLYGFIAGRPYKDAKFIPA